MSSSQEGAWTLKSYAGFCLGGIEALHGSCARAGSPPCADHLVLGTQVCRWAHGPPEGQRHYRRAGASPVEMVPELPQPTAGLFCRPSLSGHHGH